MSRRNAPTQSGFSPTTEEIAAACLLHDLRNLREKGREWQSKGVSRWAEIDPLVVKKK